MSKISLSKLLAGFLSNEKINQNYDKITDAFEKTLSRDGTAPNAMGATLDMGGNRIINLDAPVDANDAVRLQDLAGGGSSVGVDWSIITNKPTDFIPNQEATEDLIGASLVAGPNMTVSYNDGTGKTTLSASGSLVADWNTMVNKPSTFAPSAHTHPHTDITDWQEAVEDTVGAQIIAGTNMTVTYNDGTGKITLDASGGGAGAQQPSQLSAFGTPDSGGVNTANNNTAFAAAEASAESAIYIPDGVYASTRTIDQFTKAYTGRGKIKLSTSYYPAKTSYMATKPTTAATQGFTGWFDGDQRFTDGGEYKKIGANVRTYDTTSRYFESNCIPHHAWFDIDSGNSGAQGFLTSGASAGATTITIHAAPSAEWVGKTVAFANGMDGTILETKTVNSVGPGNTITVNSGIANNYTWNPSSGLIPTIFFGHRTWNGHTYVKVNHNGGGDGYGHIVRMNVAYNPKPSETHCFMACTGGQYGGSVDFQAGSTGTYATGWESQYNDNGNDVAVIAQVDSFVRTKDADLTRGLTWLGTKFQSGGTRPCDAAHVITGPWRNGLDSAFAQMQETALLVDPIVIGQANIKVNSLNGALIGDTISIGDSPVYSGTITAINVGTSTVTISPAVGSNYTANTIVKYTKGGAVLNMALGQRVVFNSSVDGTKRSSDPRGVYSTNYGNSQGDIIMETNNDGVTDYWAVRYTGNGHSGATARIRLRPTSFQVNVVLQGGQSIEAAKELSTNGSAFASGGPCVVFGSGLGNYIIFESGQFRFYKSNSLVFSI